MTDKVGIHDGVTVEQDSIIADMAQGRHNMARQLNDNAITQYQKLKTMIQHGMTIHPGCFVQPRNTHKDKAQECTSPSSPSSASAAGLRSLPSELPSLRLRMNPKKLSPSNPFFALKSYAKRGMQPERILYQKRTSHHLRTLWACSFNMIQKRGPN